MPRLDPGFSLAMTSEMRATVVALANKEQRSVGEMLRRLVQEALDARTTSTGQTYGDVVAWRSS